MTPSVWRSAIAGWSDPWRQRWGELASALEVDHGLDWRSAEERAFGQVDAERFAAGGADPPRPEDLGADRGDDGPRQALLFGGAA